MRLRPLALCRLTAVLLCGSVFLAAGAVISESAPPDPASYRKEIEAWRASRVKRFDRLGVRVKDADAPAFAAFKGLDNFPVQAAWWVTARFVV